MSKVRTVEEQARVWALQIFEALSENDLHEESLDENATNCWPSGEDDYEDEGAFTPEAEALREALFRSTAAHLSLLLSQRALGFMPSFAEPVAVANTAEAA